MTTSILALFVVVITDAMPIIDEPINLVLALPSRTYAADREKNTFELSLDKVLPVLQVAVDDVYHVRRLLPAHSVQIRTIDTRLRDDTALVEVVRMSTMEGMHALLGMANTQVIERCARVSKLLPNEQSGGTPMITTTGRSFNFDLKAQYPLLTRMVGSYNSTGVFAHKLITDNLKFTGTRVAFLLHETMFFDPSSEYSECFWATLSIKKRYMFVGTPIPNDYHKLFDEQRPSHMNLITDYLKELSTKANLIILCASPDTVRHIMLAAHKLGMTKGEYVFINIDVSTGSHARQPWKRNNDSNGSDDNQAARDAYRALKTISLRRSNQPQYAKFEKRVQDQAERMFNYTAVMGKPYQMNNFISAFYDAVLLYAIALRETLDAKGDPRNGTEITNRMWNRTFEGNQSTCNLIISAGIAGNVSIDANGDRYSDYSLLDLDPVKDEFVEVAFYSGTSKELRVKGPYHWAGEGPPKDHPVCGWDRSLCPDGPPAYVYAIVTLLLIVFLMGIISFFVLRHYQQEAELAAMSWRIRWDELTGEERKRERRKNRAAGTAWLLDGGDGDQMNPLIDRKMSGSSLSRKDTSNAKNNLKPPLQSRMPSIDNSTHSPLAITTSRKISQFITSKLSRRSGDNQPKNTVVALNPMDCNHVQIELESPTHHSSAGGAAKSVSDQKLTRADTQAASVHKTTNVSSGDKCSQPGSLKSPGPDTDRRVSSTPAFRKNSVASMKSVTSEETINLDGRLQIYTKTAVYRGQMVALKPLKISKAKIELTRAMLIELKRIKDLQHDHVNRFVGACIDYPNYVIVTEYCNKGSLEDLLGTEGFRVDKMMLTSLMHDLVKGMTVIHNHPDIRSHGYLKSSNCVVDSRFVLKVTDFGLCLLRSLEDEPEDDEEKDFAYYRKMLWTAPELLRRTGGRPIRDGGTQKGDVFSFAMILHELLFNRGPMFTEDEIEPRETIRRMMQIPSGPSDTHRPSTSIKMENDIDLEFSTAVIELMENCWTENPEERPNFTMIRKTIHGMNKEYETVNIVDNLLKRMTQYAENLEDVVKERTAEYLEEKHKVENLLHQLLPPSVADTLISGNPVLAEAFESVTIYFSDIVGFTQLSSTSTPMEVVTLLGDLYTKFDACIAEFDVYKVETIGDAYMVVSGLPIQNVCKMALGLLNLVKTFRIRHRPGEQLKLRIGLHTGSVCAGVVGLKMPRYCLFGDTVNTASRMESNGLPLKIHVSSDTHDLVMKSAEAEDYTFELRGQMEMKGKGIQTTYWLKRWKHVTVPEFPDNI